MGGVCGAEPGEGSSSKPRCLFRVLTVLDAHSLCVRACACVCVPVCKAKQGEPCGLTAFPLGARLQCPYAEPRGSHLQ